MKKSMIILRIFLFLVVFTLLFALATNILKDKRVEGEYNPTTKVQGFYKEDKNSLDFVFVGSSQVYADIAPAVLWRDYGITSYDFTANEQPMWITYFYIKEALKHQNPKAIVLDVFTMYGDDYEEEGVNHINLDDLPWSKNKIDAIRNAVPKELQSSFFLEIMKYHTTWEGLDQIKFQASFKREKDPMKGYSPFVFAREYADTAPKEVVNQKEKIEIPAKAKEWLLKINELTKEEGVDLILIKTPNGNAERQKLYNSVAELAEKEQIPFLNMNTVLDGEAHINVLQAEKVTGYVGTYLIEHYDIEDKRGKAGYEDWEKSAKLFARYKKKCEVINADTLEEYIACIKDDPDLLVMLTMKGTEVPFTEKEMALFAQLGLSCHLNQNPSDGYLALLDGGTVLLEAEGSKEVKEKTELLRTSYGMDKENKDETFTVTLRVDDAAKEGREAVMKLDGLDYSLNLDGVNIVIYDKVLGETYEMVGFDGMREFEIERK